MRRSLTRNERQAIAAAQLPDPKLSGGLKDLPVDTGEAYSLRRDNFTEFTVGLSQELPRADKRRLKGERKQLDAETERAALENDRRAIRRDTSLAWLDVYEAEQGLTLARQQTSEAALQVKSLEKDYGNGKASQADWLAAKVESGLVQDKEHDWLHHAQRMRAGLARWIGEDAERPFRPICHCLERPMRCRNSWRRLIIIRSSADWTRRSKPRGPTSPLPDKPISRIFPWKAM